MAAPQPDFLGTGWSFPPTFSRGDNAIALVSDLVDIHQSLRILLSTARGERIMVPRYGCDLWRYVFRALTATLTAELKDVVEQAIVLWEPRIDVLAVDVTIDPTTPGRANIDVSFVVRQTNVRSNLVYPFYLTEATAAGTVP
jgi:phage baseplate assembly protein W